MSDFSVASLPEVFVSDSSISKAIYDAVERGQLRKLGSRLYTRNLQEDSQRLVRRNWYTLLGSYYPDAVITDRTAMENKPAEDGGLRHLIEETRDRAARAYLSATQRTSSPGQ